MTRYQHDPRVVWSLDDRFFLPDKNTARWDYGDEWSIEFDGRGWNAFDPQGRRFYTDADGRPDFEPLLRRLLGPPLWAREADIIRWAAHHDGWIPAWQETPEQDEPDTWGTAGVAALDNLRADYGNADIFQYHRPPGQEAGYALTERGCHLADELARVLGEAWHIGHGPLWPLIADHEVWADVERLIVDNVPQTHAYGVSEPHTSETAPDEEPTWTP